MEEKKEKDLEEIFLEVKDYVDARVHYTKLSYVEKGSRLFADLITNTTVIICFVLSFLFGSVTLSLYLSAIFDSYTKGFGCVAGIYLLLSIIVFLTKDRYIERLLVNLFIRKYFDKVADRDEEK